MHPNRTPSRLILGVVIVFQLILAGAWIWVDKTPPYWDEAWYLYQGAVQYDTLSQEGISAWYDTWTTMDTTRPSLVSTLSIPFFAVFGVSDDSGLLVNLVALVLLLLAIYSLGGSINGKPCGLLSALAIASYPVLIGLSHILLNEMVMVALVAAVLLSLWRSHRFRDWRWSALAGGLTGLGLLTKPSFFVFVIGPWAVVCWQTWRNEIGGVSSLRSRVLRNFTLALFLASAIAGPWYFRNVIPMTERSMSASVGIEGAPYGPADPFYWRNLLAYFLQMVGTVTSPVGFLLFVLGITGLVGAPLGITGLVGAPVAGERKEEPRPSDDRRPALFLASSAVIGYAVFTSLRNQDMKHVVGILPAVAVLTGWGLSELIGRRWMMVAIMTVGVVIGQTVLGTFPGALAHQQVSMSVLGERLILFYPAQSWVDGTRYATANPTEWPLEDALKYAIGVADLQEPASDPVRVAILPDFPGIEEHAFRFEAYRQGLPADISTAQLGNLQDQDILIHKTGGWGWPQRVPQLERIMNALEEKNRLFQELPRTFPLPDGSEMMLYAHSSPLLSVAPQPEESSTTEFGHSARFLGFDSTTGVSPSNDRKLEITYYWETLAPTEGDYEIFVHLLDPTTGKIVVQDDHPLFPQVYPSSMWQRGRYLCEVREVHIPSDFSGASLLVRVGLYRDAVRLPVTSSDRGKAGVDYLDAGLVELNTVWK